MALQQRVLAVRRSYNQLVANETMEDYALRYTAAGARKFSTARIVHTAFGATSFLALEAIGGSMTLQYGTVNAVCAIVAVGLLIALVSAPIAYFAVRHGVDIDLLTRAAGFGYIGSTVTSLIYATFTFIFFAIEATIFAGMLHAVFGLPLWLGYICSALAVIPLVAYGVTFISRFQRWTQPLWLFLNFLPILFLLLHPGLLHGWRHYRGAAAPPGFSWLAFGTCASVLSALIAQVGEQVDYLRFLKPAAPGRRFGWWAALLSAGPGWVLPGMVKMLAGSVFTVLAVEAGLSATAAAQPATMYHVAYGMFTSPALAVLAMAALITVAQTKINVTNAYAGSIAWSNFFSRLTHRHPGRVVWLVFNVAIALLLMELGIYRAIEPILTLYSILACAWVGAICADLVLVKSLGFGRAEIEFKRAHLYDINPVGTGGMACAVLVGLLAKAGFAGPAVHAFAPFLALFAAFIAVPLLAATTRGRFYLARKPRRTWAGRLALQCGVCGNEFEAPDVAFCPAYAAPICSLCCTLESRCLDACKPHARYSVQLTATLKACLPAGFRRRLDPLLLRFMFVFGFSLLAIGVVLLTVYWQANSFQSSGNALAGALWRVFFCLMLIAGVFAWLQVLARDSGAAAEEERSRQTRLLLEEIDAHRKTDAKLARARQVAEAANLAKTRFVVGVSHELRTPLNAVLGYAQLLELDPSVPEARREAIRIIRRSGEHLHGLIEGLMDISKIEAGRIEIERKEIRFADFLDQIAGMFRVQAAAKGIHFRVQYPPNLPPSVVTDETRLRQILINLLSNALKFTEHGEIGFLVRLPGEVMEFEITDTGPGIAPEHLERIFEPFERAAATPAPGIGLGLTITKLLVEILGGRITVESKPGVGSIFRVQLRIPAAARAPAPAASRPIVGYDGRRRTILAAEDNALHRGLLIDMLSPLGFDLVIAPDGPSCLRLAAGREVDLFLLDISMLSFGVPPLGSAAPDGLEVARQLRAGAHADTPIIMLSAHVPEIKKPKGGTVPYDMAMAKPIDMAGLLAGIGRLLALTWRYGPATQAAKPGPAASDEAARTAIQPYLGQLRAAARIGFVRELRETLGRVAVEAPEAAGLAASLLDMTAALQLPELCGTLDRLAMEVN
ncbi:MAG TPA: ATP-binding protein [Acidocella sp.]|uniref:hybrid sensor histidine kinase/response regulator n=1 Tax=Acidocella sp. TaxID=50710 RepID=UPI002CB6F203|nr:ATP-binding protein [Acidocella sp.]HVE20467.1 ATP-binding protein [Acidocella sp.]